MPLKWSSGRACGPASTTQRTGSALLRSHALMEKMEKKKGAQKEPKRAPRIMCVFSKRDFENAQKWYRKRYQIIELMLERFPLKLEACIS